MTNNYKNTTLYGRTLSNIICTKEAQIKQRAKPKYGSLLFLVQQINDQAIPNAQPHQGQSRLILNLFYLLGTKDPVANALSKLRSGIACKLELDPWKVFLKPEDYQYFQSGYHNYQLSCWGNQDILNLEAPYNKLRLMPPFRLTPQDAWDYLQQVRPVYTNRTLQSTEEYFVHHA